ncbi:hypothetical protein HYS91_01785 [Candidatus Daviesbacteria bacterium]|nr:hypothetical protein [Candidatus Daviesbacteria bacterium]
MTAIKLVISSWLLGIGFLFLLVTPVFAQNATPSASSATPSATPYPQPVGYVDPQSPVHANKQIINFIHAFSCIAVGKSIIGTPCIEYISQINSSGIKQAIPVLSSTNLSGGLLGSIQNIIGGMYDNKPLDSKGYLASLGKEVGIIDTANAQVLGSGSNVLNPILALWQVSRNIAYVVMMIIFLVIGLMIMFRQRLNPQTVVSIQLALPGLVIGLVFITFSYFLAALLVDTAFLATNIAGFYFQIAGATSPTNPQFPLVNAIAQENVFSIISRFTSAPFRVPLASAIDTILPNIQGEANTVLTGAMSIIAYQYGSQIGSVVVGGAGLVAAGLITVFTLGAGAIAAGAIATAASTLGAVAGGVIAAEEAYRNPGNTISWALFVIVIFILLYTMVRVLLQLINNYLNIIFLTITAPFHFLIASLPGRQGMATDWIRNMLCNVLAFPAVLTVFYFVAYLIGGPPTNNVPFAITKPLEISGQSTFPLLGGLSLDFIKYLLAFGAILATPAIPNIICEAIGKVGRAGQMIEREIQSQVQGGQGYYGKTTAGTESIQRSATGLGQFAPTTIQDLDPAGNVIQTRRQPGLWGRIRHGW